MKIGFIFDTPLHLLDVFQRTMTDAENSVCFLAIELAKLGHDVTVFSQTTNTNSAFNVRCLNMSIVDGALNLNKAILETDFNVLIIVNNSPDFITSLKQSLPYKVKMLLWLDLDYTDQNLQLLDNSDVAKQVDALVCVSNWQRSRILAKYSIPKEKVAVRYYAITPFFQDLFTDGKEFVETKSKTPLIAYTGNPLGGLEIMLHSFGDIMNNYPTSELNIFSNLDVKDNNKYTYEALTELTNITKGVKYFGSVPKAKLAAMLRTHSMCAYPSTIEEVSNVNLMEAMAAGLYVVTSNIGGLPEYCTEHGKCVPVANLKSDSLDSFIGQALGICQSQLHTPSAFYDYCYKQSVDMNKKHTWAVRAREWVKMLNIILGVNVNK